jgi:preprotein translocase subunit SecD
VEDKELVALAEKTKGNDVFREEDGKPTTEVAGRWVPVSGDKDIQALLAADKNIVQRSGEAGLQVLLLVGNADVTQHHLRDVVKEADEFTGNPTLRLELSPEGKSRMTALTTHHISTEKRSRYLGIVIDGTLINAPRIRDSVTGQVQLAGRWSETEAADLAAVLRAGPLPSPLELESAPMGIIHAAQAP